MIAFLEAQRAGLYARAQWLPNIVAGVIVGVVALPLAMAFAIAPRVKLVAAPIGKDNLGGENEVKTCRDTDKDLKIG